MRKTILALALLTLLPTLAAAQRMIEYSSGMGSRDPENGNIWILYRGVIARHEGMTLESDSAHYDTDANSFTAFGGVTITFSDTTFIVGNRLLYNGNSRVVDIWDDTVVLVDGGTHLLANHITYERNRATAYYTQWGHATSTSRTLSSQQGQYNSDLKEFYIYNDVVLTDTNMRLETDTLIYNTRTTVAHFESPTIIYSDSSIIYSELGDYNTETRFAISYAASHATNQGRTIDSDTLYYDTEQRYGKAFGHVVIVDSINDITCTGRYGETDQTSHFSLVTDSAHVLFVDQGDSLFLHADTIFVVTDTANNLSSVRANYKVKVFRRDAQAMCDSAFYDAADSTLALHHGPVLWYDHYQCSADTIILMHDSTGVRRADLFANCFAMQQVDAECFNQLKGRNGVVYFRDGEPHYADVMGNAQMVYYITEDDSLGHPMLIGVNVGYGSDIRIYFDSTRAPARVVAFDRPDMSTYPVNRIPDELRRLPGFSWMTAQRPRRPEDVFLW